MTSRFTKLAMGALALAAAAFAVAATAAEKGKLTRETIAVGKLKRTFIVYAPAALKPSAPLLFVFHGSGGTGADMREEVDYEFDKLADQHGFVVIYPDGFMTTWNDCRKGSPQPARFMNIDDEGFVTAMIDKEAADRAIDKKRVFTVGHSNGGQLGYRLGLEHPEQFAGVAAISAGLPTTENLACTPTSKPIAVMIVNGTSDPINPYNGGMVTIGGTPLGTVLSSRATAEYFAKLNGLTGMPATVRLPHKIAADPTWVDKYSWSAPGKPGVVLYGVHGGGHVVPIAHAQDWGQLGLATLDLDAPTAVWDFFAAQPSR